MPHPDIRFRTYLRAFTADLFALMCGPLTVPFAAIALWVSSRSQKILWGCLAILCAVVASYRVWRKQRLNSAEEQAHSSDEQRRAFDQLKRDTDAEIAALREQVATLSRKPYAEDVERTCNQVLDAMTHEGHVLLRHLLMHERVELGRHFIPEIAIERQNEQIAIAFKSGIVRHDIERHGGMTWTFLVINPTFRPVLQDILYKKLR